MAGFQGADDPVHLTAQISTRLLADPLDADHHVAVLRFAVLLNDGVAAERFGDPVQVGRLVELQDDDRPALEVDSLLQTARGDHEHAGEDDHGGERQGVPAPADEVVSWDW